MVVVLDACVLYPVPVRDILLSLAAEGLIKVKWSETIQDEWIRNLLKNRVDLVREQLARTVDAMNSAFPDANVIGFEKYIPTLNLPDKDDRHVVACALHCNASILVTYNLKDFPDSVLSDYEIEVQSPDELIMNIIEAHPQSVCKALDKMVKRLKNPPKTKSDVLKALQNCGLFKSVEKLRSIC